MGEWRVVRQETQVLVWILKYFNLFFCVCETNFETILLLLLLNFTNTKKQQVTNFSDSFLLISFQSFQLHVVI